MSLSLQDFVNVIVEISPVSSIRNGFNIGLIIGNSTHITTATRVKEYSSTDDMIADGWVGTEPEFKAAQNYFGQSKKPPMVVIGALGNAEPILTALTDCRTKNTDWYAVYVCGITKTDILTAAQYIEAAVPTSALFFTTADADVLAGTAGNVFQSLMNLEYHKTIGQYSTDADAAAAIMGYALGANTGLANSAYTLMFKQEVGVVPEALTAAQVLSIEGNNGNIYVNRGATYNMFEKGVMADGTPFDEVINLDMLQNNIQMAVMDLLTSVSKVPQTDGGVTLLVNAIIAPLEAARVSGFIAPGVWNSDPVYTLNTGDALPTGYAIMSESIDMQSESDRQARKAPPIYIAAKLAGAVEHAVITVIVNR